MGYKDIYDKITEAEKSLEEAKDALQYVSALKVESNIRQEKDAKYWNSLSTMEVFTILRERIFSFVRKNFSRLNYEKNKGGYFIPSDILDEEYMNVFEELGMWDEYCESMDLQLCLNKLVENKFAIKAVKKLEKYRAISEDEWWQILKHFDICCG